MAEMTSWWVRWPPPAAHQTLMPRLSATRTKASRPRRASKSRRTVRVKFPVTSTGASGPGCPTRLRPVRARWGSMRRTVSRT